MKRFTITALVMVIVSVSLLFMLGAADNGAAAASGEEANSVYDAMIGAKNVQLALGAYVSEDGTTAQLTDVEIQAQLDAYNAEVDRYYALDNVCREEYKDWNETMLRESYVDETFYRLEGGVLDYQVHNLEFNSEKTEATLKLTATLYNKWISETEDGDYWIQCCAGNTEMTAVLVKEDGDWKLLRYDSYQKQENWMPQDILSDHDTAAYAASTEADAEALEAGELANAEYDNFADAVEAANRIHVADICPLSA